MNGYPGTIEHQHILDLIGSYYADEPRILAVGLFGSLVRGNWDEFSDLDLDVVIHDGVQINVQAELTDLCCYLHNMGEEVLITLVDGPDSGDVVLASLVQFSIRYHSLATTNWKIIDSLQLLHGDIDKATIVMAGEANRRCAPTTKAEVLINRTLRFGLGVSIEVRRHRLWLAVELLHRMRTLLMELFAITHGHERAIQSFEADAAPSLQQRLMAMLPQGETRSVLHCLESGVDFLAEELATLTDGQVILTTAQRRLLRQLRHCCTELRQEDQ